MRQTAIAHTHTLDPSSDLPPTFGRALHTPKDWFKLAHTFAYKGTQQAIQTTGLQRSGGRLTAGVKTAGRHAHLVRGSLAQASDAPSDALRLVLNQNALKLVHSLRQLRDGDAHAPQNLPLATPHHPPTPPKKQKTKSRVRRRETALQPCKCRLKHTESYQADIRLNDPRCRGCISWDAASHEISSKAYQQTESTHRCLTAL